MKAERVHHQAFAPGTDDFDVLARKALELRRPDGDPDPTTNILSTSGTLEHFMKTLVPPSLRVTHPVREIILLSHAAETGWLEMALTDDKRNEIQWEQLANAKDALNIPKQVLMEGGAVRPAIVRVRGCRIGIAKKFLLKFKEKLKNVSTITAPKHYWAASTWGGEINPVARMEFLLYCFESYPKRPLDSSGTPAETSLKKDVIKTMKADKHLRLDRSQVPDSQWEKWLDDLAVPKAVNVGLLYPTEKLPRNVTVQLPPSWQVAGARGKISGVFKFQHLIRTDTGKWDLGKEGPTGGSAAERRAFVSGKFRDAKARADKNFALFFEDHEWPIWERQLKVRDEPFASFDEFMEGFDWIYVNGNWSGVRHVYRMLVPIMLPVDSNILLANYYPVGAAAAHVDLAAWEETEGPLFAVL